MRADALGFERVKGLPATAADPDRADRGRRLASGARKPLSARQPGQSGQGARLHQTSPAIHDNEHTEDAEPEGLHPNGNHDKAGQNVRYGDGHVEWSITYHLLKAATGTALLRPEPWQHTQTDGSLKPT